MSQTTKTSTQETKPQSKSKYSSEQASRIFKHIDERLQELGDRVLPKQPYLITFPSDVPYRRHLYDPNTWHIGTPFSKDEEQLQYMSFLPKEGEEEELLKAEGEWADEAGNLLAWDSSSQTDYTSRPNTPAAHTPVENTGPRKKISLKDYKTKDKSAVNTPERRPVGEDLRKEHFKSKVDKEHIPTKKEDDMDDSHGHEAKNSLSHSDKNQNSETQPERGMDTAKVKSTRDEESPRPAKRRKLSAESPSPKDDGESVHNNKSQPEDSKPLPTLLSPTIPSQEKRKLQLPGLLSPNLPPGLDKAVSQSAFPRTDEVRSILKGMNSPGGSSDKKASNSPSKETTPSRAKPDTLLSVKAASSNIAKLQSPALKPVSAATSKPGTPGTSPRPRQRHTIVLKYGKKNRKRVEALLKFKPKPKKPAIASDNGSTASKPSTKEPEKAEKKRPNDQRPEYPSKKPMTTNPRDHSAKPERPSTPVANSNPRSPSASASKMRSAFSTPKKDLKSAAMQRVASSDTTEARTPSGDMAKTSTPTSSNQLTKASPGHSSSSVKAEDKAAWMEMNEKYFAIGRKLKREGTKLAGDANSKEHSLSVVLLIEALLCFMINSGAQSQARPNVDPGWSTIIPYHIMVFKQSRRYRHIHGLVVQLGAICRQNVQNEDMKRLAREPLPDDQLLAAPTPGSDGTTRTNDDPERYKKRYLEFRDSLVQNAKELQTAWLDGSRILPLELLEHDYPKTWKQRSKDASKRHPDKLNPKSLSKDFYLPLDMTTNVFEATNFTLAFLKEWTQLEGVKWDPTIEL